MVNFPGVNFIVGLAKDYVFRRGKHHYKFSIVTSCAPSKAFGMLKSPGMSAPGAPQAIDGKYQVELMGGNWVTQDVSDANMTIINETIRDRHTFDPGSVRIVVSGSGFGSRITVEGTGSGRAPELNEAVGLVFFGLGSALSVQQACAEPLPRY